MPSGRKPYGAYRLALDIKEISDGKKEIENPVTKLLKKTGLCIPTIIKYIEELDNKGILVVAWKRGASGGIEKIILTQKMDDKEYLSKTLGENKVVSRVPPPNIERLKTRVAEILDNSIMAIHQENAELKIKIAAFNETKKRLTSFVADILDLCKTLGIKIN